MDNLTDTQPEPAAGADPQLVLRGTAHLLASVPHLLGYRPGRSVVVIASTVGDTGARGARTYRAAVVLTVRFDLPEPDAAREVVATLVGPLAQARTARAGRSGGGAGPVRQLLLHAFVYEADDAVVAAVATEVVRLAVEHDHQLHDLVLVRDGRYRPLVSPGDDLDHLDHLGDLDPRPRDLDRLGDLDGVAIGGTALDGWLPVPAPADVPAVADLVLQGRFAACSRDDVVARVRRRDERAAAATDLALRLLAMAPESYDPLDALGRLSRWVVRGEDEPAPRDRARIVVALDDRILRDAVMARWLPRLFALEDVLPEDLAEDARRVVEPWPVRETGALDRLLDLAARVPEPSTAPLLTLVAAVSWGLGEGTVANEAVDLALEVDPGYQMAALLREAVSRGMPPWLRRAQVA